MKRTLNIVLMTAILMALVYLPGCATSLASAYTERATMAFTTAIHQDLISLPPLKEKIVVAVYKFRDQTGQYKPHPAAVSFSTAVPQGSTSMAIKAFEDAGNGRCWIPIEREGLANLLNERQIIRSTRMQHKAQGNNNENLPPLPALLYAGVLIEGGIIAYDTNLVTGGVGARYFGLGGSGQFRRDQVTVYLRAVAVQNGKILKTVTVTKSILSREVDFGVYRFVRIKRLLEAEIGLSTNEPVSMCVLEAIEYGVYALTIEGIQDGLWTLENPEDINSPLVQNYLKEKQATEKIVTFDKEGNLVAVQDVE